MEQTIIAHNFKKQNTVNGSKLMSFIAWVLINTAALRSLSAI